LSFFSRKSSEEKRGTVNLAHPKDPVLAEWLGVQNTLSGIPVNAESAMTDATVYACVNVLSTDLAKLPLIVYQRNEDGTKQRAIDHPLYKILKDTPNGYQTSFQFREFGMNHVLMRGNCYSFIERRASGRINRLLPLDPMCMNVVGLGNWEFGYVYRGPDGKEVPFMSDEILHIAGHTKDGIKGVSVIESQRDTIGASLGGKAYATTLFKNSATPGVVLEHPGVMSPEAFKKLKKSWEQRHKGVENAHKVAILEEGLKVTKFGMTAEESQMLESREFSRAEIASIFRVPQHKVGILKNATFSNIEQQALEYVTDSLLPWLRRWEQSINRDCLTSLERERGYFVEFLVDGLLRGDSKARGEYYRTLFNIGALSPNDIRNIENMNPIEDGDSYYVPVNMQKVGFEVVQDDQEEVESEMEENQASSERFYKLAQASIDRILRKEDSFIQRARDKFDGDKLNDEIDKFLSTHSNFISEAVGVDSLESSEYVKEVRDLFTQNQFLVDDFRRDRLKRMVGLI